jgi:hypothetical protein
LKQIASFHLKHRTIAHSPACNKTQTASICSGARIVIVARFFADGGFLIRQVSVAECTGSLLETGIRGQFARQQS